MAVFKCKMCGGQLEFSAGESICMCQYCGTQQTLPKFSDERSSTLYERADHFRRNNDFNKAINIYEQILNENNTDAEAYWSLVLCRYGIEYVDDPKSNKRIATVNRTQFTSVLADEDYKSAIKYADLEQKQIYETEAKEIDNIQKGILSISQKEEPFDIFICYKETDNNGRRTPDSVLANELYHQLTKEGYKVFFSRITLEDKLGSAYEPYIFAALNSSKVMVVIGTKPEYFNAVWVKNEWSRFLTLIKNGAEKVLIPAYRDMDPYNLPEEFSHLQAQDMSKLGFMQDLIYGIKKITKASNQKETKEPTVSNSSATAPLLRRAFLFLEDSDWNSADEYFEKVLDLEPENAEAYLGKMMLELRVRRREELAELSQGFESNSFYKKIIRFGDEKLISEIDQYIKTINQKAEYVRLNVIYKEGETLLTTAKTKEEYLLASQTFASISGFKDADKQVVICKEKAKDVHYGGLYDAAMLLMNSAKTEQGFIKAGKAFEAIKEYKDAHKLSEDCKAKAEQIKNNTIYDAAVALKTGNKIANYKKAILEFEKICDFKDSNKQIEICNQKIAEINSTLSAAQLKRQNLAEERADAFKKKLPLIKKITLVVIPTIIVAIVAASIIPQLVSENDVFGEETSRSDVISQNESIVSEEQTTSEEATSSEQTETTSSDGMSSTPQTSSSVVSSNSTMTSSPQVNISQNNEDDFTIWLENGEYILQGYYGSDKNVVIPSTKNGAPVVGIGYGVFEDNKLLESVTIPSTIKSIDAGAFRNCTNLETVIIPSSVKGISQEAFSGCTSLKSVTIPSSVSEWGMSPFEGCTALKYVTIESGVKVIPVDAFQGCTSLESITIPSSVVEIESGAFSGCTSLKGVTVSSGVKTIGWRAFADCTSLESITIPASVVKIDAAFENCVSLKSITIPASVSNIGQNAFYGCTSLVEVNLSNGITSIEYCAFENCASLKSITIPASITEINWKAFIGCTSLKKVYFSSENQKNEFGDCFPEGAELIVQ